jgi:histidyl-tRNA synthetase
MAGKVAPRVPRGMRDILPEQMIRRQYVMRVIQEVFEEFGFEPFDTPALELSETLTGKYGSEAERLIYNATYGDKKEKLSLRYDLSVPLCRVMAMYPDILKPFKRYQISAVWRAERPQRGRYREFYQCDADEVGSASMLADAETICLIYEILTRLGFREFTIHINDRKILNGIGQFAGVPERLLGGLYRSIDKLPKIDLRGVEQELKMVGLPEGDLEKLRQAVRLYLQGKMGLEDLAVALQQEGTPGQVIATVQRRLPEALGQNVEPDQVQEAATQFVRELATELRQAYQGEDELIPEEVVSRLLTLLQIGGENKAILSQLREQLADYLEALEGISELEEIIRYLEALGIPERYYQVDFAMVRGLEYYTGPIYETIVKDPDVGSITGGGRYDDLIGMFSDRSYPATGTSIGIERIIDVMEEKGMFPADIGKTLTQVLVTIFDEDLVDESLKVTSMLRKAGLRTEIYLEKDSLGNQIRYALKKGIPYIVIMGPDELANGKVTVKNLAQGEQRTVERGAAARLLRNWSE